MAMSATPASAQTSGYEDVTDGIHAEAIAAITDAGVAEGCEEDRYCPLEVVRRDQMASFLARALGLEAVDDRRFDDVPVDNVHRGAINALAEAGITQGCAPERFCPDAPVSRAEMASFLARAQELVAPVSIPMLLQPGDEGPAVQALQQRLENHDYWVGPIDGGYGTLTEQAVLAIQKVHGLLRDGIYGPSTRAAVADPQPPSTASSEGYVVEFDEDRQLVLLVQDGVAGQIFHASGGNEDSYEYAGTTYVAETPNGSWDVYREIDGWRTSHLGELYRPKYFHTAGIAIHGSNSVPAQAASHGCVRVSIDAMDWLWANEALPIGADVLVYGSPT